MLRMPANLLFFFFTLSREFGQIVVFEVEAEKLYLNYLRRKTKLKNHRHEVLKTRNPQSLFVLCVHVAVSVNVVNQTSWWILQPLQNFRLSSDQLVPCR